MPVNFLDVITWDSVGPYRIVPPELLTQPRWENHDFRLTLARPVWSIGRAIAAATIVYQGQPYTVPAGTALASLTSDMYQRAGFECIWLR